MLPKLKFTTLIKSLHAPLTVVFILICLSSQGQSIKFLRSSSYELGLSSGTTIFRIPVTISKDSGKIELRLIDVTFENPQRAISGSAFKAEKEVDSLNNAFLRISINNESRLDKGKYHLLFNIVKTNTVAQPEAFSIDLTVKPATIAPVNTIVVSRVQHWPFTSYTRIRKSLPIFETSRNSAISPLTVRELSLVDGKGTNVPNTVKFTNTNQVIEAGLQGDLTYEITDDFPIGTVSGTYEISAPQLAAPQQFKMEITSKRGAGWILIIIWTGILFSYLTKTALNKILQFNRARKEALDLDQLLNDEKTKRPDDKFRLALSDMQTKLAGSANKTAEEITRLIAEVKTAYTAALTDFTTRQANLQAKVIGCSDALTGIWFLPKKIEDLITIANNGLLEVNKAIKSNEIGTGEKLFQKINQELARSLVVEAQLIKRQFMNVYDRIKSSNLKIAVDSSTLLTEINNLATATATMPQDKFDEDPTQIKAFLQSLSNQRLQFSNLLYRMATVIRSVLTQLSNIFSGGRIDLQNELLAIRKNADAKFILSSDKALDDSIDAVEEDMKEIQDSIVLALTAAKFKLTGEQLSAIENELSNGQYSQAANKLVEIMRPPVINESHMAQYETWVLDTMPQLNFPGVRETGFIVNPASVADISNNVSAINALYPQIVRTIFWTSLLQTLLIGLGISIFGYALFAEKFTGTLTDMIEIFSWALVLDLSLNSLTTIAGAVPAKIKG